MMDNQKSFIEILLTVLFQVLIAQISYNYVIPKILLEHFLPITFTEMFALIILIRTLPK